MRSWISLLLACVITGCTASTVSVQLTPTSESTIQFDHEKEKPAEAAQIQEVTIPKKMMLTVPFTVQAPLANWDDPYQEACEEASVIMVDYFLRNAALTQEQANREIIQLTTWEESNSYKHDVSVLELAAIIEKYYEYSVRISTDVSKESIMYEISKGNPVIVPAAGRTLGNPYYSGQGPLYHMLVITGYDQKNFITNDPGTKRGLNFEYKHAVLLNAIHDWAGLAEEIESGAKRMLIIQR